MAVSSTRRRDWTVLSTSVSREEGSQQLTLTEAIGPDRIVLVRTDVRHEIVVKDRPGKQVAAARQKK
jgi:hypothetical protein